MRIGIHFGPVAEMMQLIRKKKNHPLEMGFAIRESKISVMKNIPPSRILTCNEKRSF